MSRLLYLIRLMIVLLLVFALGKVAFMTYNSQSMDAFTASDVWQVLLHGFTMDLSTCGYLLIIPWLFCFYILHDCSPYKLLTGQFHDGVGEDLHAQHQLFQVDVLNPSSATCRIQRELLVVSAYGLLLPASSQSFSQPFSSSLLWYTLLPRDSIKRVTAFFAHWE